MAEYWVLIGHVTGAFGLFFGVGSFQFKNSKTMLGIQFVANLFWTAHFTIIGAPVGAVMVFIGALRNATGFCLPKQYLPGAAMAFSATALIASLFVMQSWIYLSACFGNILITTSILAKDQPLYFRILQFLGESFWLTYAVTVSSWPGIAFGIILLASNIVGAIRHEKEEMRALFAKIF